MRDIHDVIQGIFHLGIQYKTGFWFGGLAGGEVGWLVSVLTQSLIL